MQVKKELITAAFITTLAFSHEEVLPQTFTPEQRLEMIIETYAKYNANLDFENGFQTTQPVIGIVTTPVFYESMKTDTFQYAHFTWETNVHFIHYAGNWAVPVRYDLPDNDLEVLLNSINGIFFTGGATPLIDRETGEMSDFYKFTKKVWKYMLRQKDQKGIDFPIFGICQGFELIQYLANEDHKETLSNVNIYNESRPMDFKIEHSMVKILTNMFSQFPQDLIEKMAKDPLLYHAHDWVIKTDTYAKRKPLANFFNVLATDTKNGEQFVMAIEGKKYAVSGVMFHPETQNRHIVGELDSSLFGKVNNETTDRINYYYSEYIRRLATKTLNTHKFEDAEFGMRMEWLNSNMGFTTAGKTSNLVSLGF